MNITTQLKQAKQAGKELATLTHTQRDAVLKYLATELIKQSKVILRANQRDLAALPKGYGMTDRILLSSQRIQQMADGVRAVVRLQNPLGELLDRSKRPSGITVERRRVPIGVIGAIFEARPNVTIDVFSLCFKTGNAVVLKGGRDAYYTSQALVDCIHQSLRRAKLPTAAVVLLDARRRELVTELLQAHGLVDVVIPRGSERLIQFVRETAKVPVIETGAGVCHTFVEKTADLALAARVVVNAKVRRCTVCNALDCLVVEQSVAAKLFKLLAPHLAQHEVELRADPQSYAKLKAIYPAHLLKKAQAKDFGQEFLAMRLAIKTVPHAAAGIQFVQGHTSGHSEAIITKNAKLARSFQERIDAAAVYVNTSTAFTDGFEFGLGAEVGISTQKLHARGPMGLAALTTYKWLVRSNGAIRQ